MGMRLPLLMNRPIYILCTLIDNWISQLSKNLMEIMLNPCGELHLSPEGPVSQIHSPHLHDGTPGIFSKSLRSVQTLKRRGVRKATGSYCIYSSLVKLQPWFLSSRLKTCLLGRTATLVPELPVKDLPLGRTL